MAWLPSWLRRGPLRLPADSTSPSDSNEAISLLSLVPLTPSYERSDHEIYFEAIENALNDKDACGIRNIALSGSYGVGKSSILQEVVRKHKEKVVEISFSTTGLSDDSPESEHTVSRVADSRTNRIQREIVKQILYREDPVRMPGSRYRRMGRFRFWRELAQAALAAAVITLVFYLLGWAQKLAALAEPYLDFGGFTPLVVFVVATAFVLGLAAMFHDRLRIEKLSAGPATISLSNESPTYFDEYLDEIVYFFDVTGREIVVFEDLDRFNEPHIFETLRALNTLLNRAGQLKDRNICFIYAIKDSIFDELGKRAAREEGDAETDVVKTEMERVNRTKFFDLVIPVVPFITHKSARDLMALEMDGLAVSADLIDLAARHLVDMRLIRNVRNEFVIFRQKVPCGTSSDLGLKEDGLFAMMLYKNTHLSYFEKIMVVKSKIDELYRDGRRLIAENRSRLAKEGWQVQKRLSNLDSIASRSANLGTKLQQYLERLEGQFSASGHQTIVHDGQTVTDDELTSAGFWRKFLSTDKPLEVTVQMPGRNQVLSISHEDAAEMLGGPLSPQDWQESDQETLKQQLKQIQEDQEFLAHADMYELIGRPEFKLKVDDGGSLPLRELAARLGSELAQQLVGGGYIDRNFTLYTSTYYGERVSSRAMNFIIHNVDPNVVDVYFSLTSSDVDAVLRERGEEVLRERGMYNIDVLNHLLESGHAKADLLIQSLTAFGDAEQSLLHAYSSEGQHREALAQKLANRWSRAFVFIISEIEVDDSTRCLLLNAALESMVEGLKYELDDAARGYFEEHYSDLDIFSSDGTSTELARQLAGLLVEMGARLSSLDGLSTNVRRAMVAEGRYVVTRANLLAAIDGLGGLALDEIRSRDRTVYDHVLGRLPEYLTALGEVDGASHTIESADAFEDVLKDVLQHSEALLPEVVASSSQSCQVPNLADVSQAAWPLLADNNRFPTTIENVIAYINMASEIDVHLAGLLRESGSVEVGYDVQEADKLTLAERLLAARDVLPDPELRTRLVTDLELEGWVPTTLIQPEPGQLIGLLIDNKIIEDTAESFALALSADWETREFAISKSENFASFMTPTEVPTGDVALLMRSGMISDEAKSVIVDRVAEFTQGADGPALAAVAGYALDTNKTLPASEVARLAQARVDTELVLLLLNRLLPTISLAELVSVLDALGGDYAVMCERNGRKPKLPNTQSSVALVQRLEQLGVVSSHKVSGEKIRVYMKKS